MKKRTLSKQDVEKLLADSSGEVRAETAAKIASEFGDASLSDNERKLAEEIFRLMIKDAEVRVREALSQNLKENPLVPHDIAVSLAKDVDAVALPVLQFSEVLSDSDLIEIVRSQGAAKQVAIAQREKVSTEVSSALIDSANEEAVTQLVSNKGADISESSLQKVVDEFGTKEKIQSAMVNRPALPVTVSERLVTMVSAHLKEELAKRHELSDSLATDLILQSRERATITLSNEGSQEDLERLIEQLHKNGRLTPSIVLRALCMGDLDFYEAAMAQLAGISVVNVRQLIHDSGRLGLKAVYDKTGLPESHFTAVRAAIDVAQETDYDGGENDRERYSRRMIERILTQYGDLGVEFDSDDLEYLLAKMNELPADTQNAA
ncbi:MAG: DUF2336 domain-containing protein [Rhodospirillales bacterium]|nr:DUF2336 domain-containing protein [Rhodospirillales bacterium]